MRKTTASTLPPRKVFRASFTLIELLTVMAIIAILAALILQAGNMVMIKGMRSRAQSEVQAMSTGLEGYKTDNGIYPNTNSTAGTPMSANLITNSAANPYDSTVDDGSGTDYKNNAQVLYFALSGQTNFSDTSVAGKSYMSFKRNQVGDATGGSYVQDPWGLAYGYSVGTVVGSTTNPPYNGYGFFDLWSTGGLKAGAATNSSAWLSNWQ